MIEGHLAQHIVAGRVSAGVVHDLEPVEVQIAQRVRRIAGLSQIQSLLQPPFDSRRFTSPVKAS